MHILRILVNSLKSLLTHNERDWVSKGHLSQIVHRESMEGFYDKKGNRYPRESF